MPAAALLPLLLAGAAALHVQAQTGPHLARSLAFKGRNIDSVAVSNAATVPGALRDQARQCPANTLAFLCRGAAKKELRCDAQSFLVEDAAESSVPVSPASQQKCLGACALLVSFPSEAAGLCGAASPADSGGIGVKYIAGLAPSQLGAGGAPFDAGEVIQRLKEANRRRDSDGCPGGVHSHTDADARSVFEGTTESGGTVTLSPHAEELRKALRTAFGEPRMLYHGTKPEFVAAILETGFRNAGVANYGPGIYFTTDRAHAEHYGSSVFECEVYGASRDMDAQKKSDASIARELQAMGVAEGGEGREDKEGPPANEATTSTAVSDKVVVIEDNLVIVPVKVHRASASGAGGRPMLRRAPKVGKGIGGQMLQ